MYYIYIREFCLFLLFLLIYTILVILFGDVLYCRPNNDYPKRLYFSVRLFNEKFTESAIFKPKYIKDEINQSIHVGPARTYDPYLPS